MRLSELQKMLRIQLFSVMKLSLTKMMIFKVFTIKMERRIYHGKTFES